MGAWLMPERTERAVGDADIGSHLEVAEHEGAAVEAVVGHAHVRLVQQPVARRRPWPAKIMKSG